jgi:hypothetical protein
MMSSATSALGLFAGAVPKFFGFVVILIVGWLIAAVVARVVGGVLRGMKFNDLADRSGFSDFVRQMGLRTDASGFIAQVARWFIRLITLIVAFDALGLAAVSQVLQQMLLWLPNAAVALAILVIGGVAAGALARLVRGAAASAELGNPDVLATITRVGVMAFTVLVAVNQLGVATDLVRTLFVGVVGGLALALGLAFGLGGRDTASEIVRGLYARGQRARPRPRPGRDVAA